MLFILAYKFLMLVKCRDGGLLFTFWHYCYSYRTEPQ